MKKISLRTMIIFSLAGLSGGLLLYSSQKVQQAEDELQKLRMAVRHERETIRVLATEWEFLNNPQRLEMLAGKYLDLVPPGAGQTIITPGALPAPALPLEIPAEDATAQPVVYALPAETKENPKAAVKPRHKPVRKPEKQENEFNNLLNKLSGEGTP